jgi:hypothetical protein
MLLFLDVDIEKSKNLTMDLFFQRLSFSHILYQSLYDDLKIYLEIFNKDVEDKVKLLEKDVFENLIVVVEQSQNELINLIKLVKMYNQKRFKNIDDVDKYIYLLTSKLKSFFDIDKKILYSKELIYSIEKYFKLINRLIMFLEEFCPGFTTKTIEEIDRIILQNSNSFTLDNLKKDTLKGIKLKSFPNVEIVHKVSGLSQDLIFIQNQDGFYIVVKNMNTDYIPLAYSLILINGYVDENILRKCKLDKSDIQHVEINKTIINYINSINTNDDTKQSSIQKLGLKLESLLGKITKDNMDIKKIYLKTILVFIVVINQLCSLRNSY